MKDFNEIDKQIFKSNILLNYKNPNITKAYEDSRYYNRRYLYVAIFFFLITLTNTLTLIEYRQIIKPKLPQLIDSIISLSLSSVILVILVIISIKRYQKTYIL